MVKKTMLTIAGLAMVFGAALVAATAAPEKEAVSTVQRAVFKVENITCGACLSKISSALEPVEGFSGMGANLLRKMVAVDFSAPLSPEKIREIVTKLGYPATLDSVEALTQKQTFAYQRSKRGGYGASCCGGAPASSTAQCPGTQGGCIVPPAAAAESKTDI